MLKGSKKYLAKCWRGQRATRLNVEKIKELYDKIQHESLDIT